MKLPAASANASGASLKTKMLEAKKSRWFEKIFALYNRNLLKRRFHSFRISGLDSLLGRDRLLPLVIYANHSSWWDGLIAFEISLQTTSDSFMMMEEKQLKKLYLFRQLGAFSVVRENPRAAVKSINYAAKLLKEKNSRTLWIFPQGEILGNDARPLNFHTGAARVIEKVGRVGALPLAIRYEFRGEFKPEIFVNIGESELISVDENFDAKAQTKNFERQLTETLDELKSGVLSGDLQNYRNILS
jgi:chlorobactene lauroyltransferase